MSSDGVSVWMPEETSSPKLSCHLTWSYKLALHSNVQMFCSASLSFSRMVVEVVGGLFWWAREGDWMDRNSRLAKIEDVKGWISTNREGVCYDTLPQKKNKKNTTNSSVLKKCPFLSHDEENHLLALWKVLFTLSWHSTTTHHFADISLGNLFKKDSIRSEEFHLMDEYDSKGLNF